MAKQRRRRRTDPELARTWRERISAWSASGLTARAYCRDQGLSEPSFYAWRRKIREHVPRGDVRASGGDRGVTSNRSSREVGASGAARPPKFVPVTVVGAQEPSASQSHAPIEIVHGSGATVRVNVTADVELLTAVFAALDRASSC